MPELAQLADRLIVRHLRVSLPEYETRRELQRGYEHEPLLTLKTRCVAVVGAGASAAALFDRGKALADSLEKQFAASPEEDNARRAELFRLQRVYGLDPADFETRLAALSRTPEVTQQVQHAITKRYDYRHPTILAYELLAHLLKHRFIDAVISFNFDELLDQSLDDELGPDEYRRLVSDRDCVSVVSDPDDAHYLPLYIKLHGTATEPESLRFTRDAYYKLPRGLTSEVESLFDSEHCTILNVGSAMTGFDLHRLLRIPEELEIYDLSKKPLSREVCDAITAERKHPPKDSLRSGEKRRRPHFGLPATSASPGRSKGCDGWLRRLMREIEWRSGSQADSGRLASLVRFRSVNRHEAVADVLGPRRPLSRWTRAPHRYRKDYVEHLRRRTILELALSGAKARGLAQVSWLAIDRCGMYYDLYRREARAAGVQPLRWNALRAAAGLDENDWLPDVVESRPALCDPDAEATYVDGRWSLREFVPELLAEQIVNELGLSGRRAKEHLARALSELQTKTEVEIQPTDDRVCSKTFDAPLTLPTVTSLDIYTVRLFEQLEPSDEVYISCETGEWLLDNPRMFKLLSRQNHVEVITAFHFKRGDLRTQFRGRLIVKPMDPWRHNRHMTIVCRGNQPWRAVYFARILRTPLITPVYLRSPADAERVKGAFDLMLKQIAETRTDADDGPAG
jgi:hypothetical protein